MGLLQRLFGATRDAIELPNFVPGSRAVEVSTTMLREVIDRGATGPEGPNRARLATLFTRGYLFGFSESCIQRFGVFDEIESLALITVVHTQLFGGQIGWLLVQDALREQGQAEFGRGQTAGAGDFLRWLNERSNTPRALTHYLLADDEASGPKVPSSAPLENPVVKPISATSDLAGQPAVVWH
jgi:hypothetical protein